MGLCCHLMEQIMSSLGREYGSGFTASCDFSKWQSACHYHMGVLHRDSSDFLSLLLLQFMDDFLRLWSIILLTSWSLQVFIVFQC